MLQNVVRWLLPREDHFYDFLERQADVAHDASNAMAEFANRDSTVTRVRAKVQDLEHLGDRIVHEMEEELAKTFVTPIDREDLQRLSSELDTVLDLINAAARASDLFGVHRPTEPMVLLMEKLIECTELLKTTLPKLRKHDYKGLLDDTRSMRKLEKDADAVYRGAISNLFQDPEVDAKTLLREMAVLDDLENAIDHCEQVSRTLANLAVKNG